MRELTIECNSSFCWAYCSPQPLLISSVSILSSSSWESCTPTRVELLANPLGLTILVEEDDLNGDEPNGSCLIGEDDI
jgi:hypothetical protein